MRSRKSSDGPGAPAPPDQAAADRAAAILGRLVVTIDGPAGSGKSTTASLLARRLGLVYLDTGAMYRAVTLAALERGIDPGDGEAAGRLAASVSIELETSGSSAVVRLDGRDVSREIRSPAVAAAVSPVSAHPSVRRAMVRLQRRIGGEGGIVAEGRDTGSVVFPHADLRVFLVADVEARARRRQAQQRALGIDESLEAIRENIRARDAIDSGRAASPLLRPAGAFVVDTSGISIEEQVALVEAAARAEAGRLAAIALAPGERNPFARAPAWYRVSRAAVRLVFRVLFGLRVEGVERLRWRENFIFASNHVSYADPPVVGCALDREVWFLAKKELFRNRAFAALIRAYHAIPVDRVEIERSTLKAVFAILRAERSLLMFPEGTRSRTGELREIKPGLGFISISAGASVVPVHVAGTNRLGRCLLRREPLRVRIGRPIRVRPGMAGDDRKTEYRVLAGMVASAIGMLRDETID